MKFWIPIRLKIRVKLDDEQLKTVMAALSEVDRLESRVKDLEEKAMTASKLNVHKEADEALEGLTDIEKQIAYDLKVQRVAGGVSKEVMDAEE